ncbi:hypothetical protein B0O80DRAFT_486872, partial [Mortierella sp. GBAus27b]
MNHALSHLLSWYGLVCVECVCTHPRPRPCPCLFAPCSLQPFCGGPSVSNTVGVLSSYDSSWTVLHLKSFPERAILAPFGDHTLVSSLPRNRLLGNKKLPQDSQGSQDSQDGLDSLGCCRCQLGADYHHGHGYGYGYSV